MTTGKMFPFITQTWNPLGGECKHGCKYCWATSLKNRYERLQLKYGGEPRIVQKELNRIKAFTETDFVFVCDMTDLFGQWVPSELIEKILDSIRLSPAKFLLLTKNPARYKEFDLPCNCTAGATIESDCDHLVSLGAPKVSERISEMIKLNHRKMVSIEPVLSFSEDFSREIVYIQPDFVAVGYDNYNHNLLEPSLANVERLIQVLEAYNIKVYRKTIREKQEMKT